MLKQRLVLIQGGNTKERRPIAFKSNYITLYKQPPGPLPG
jgi:hypothetical protein